MLMKTLYVFSGKVLRGKKRGRKLGFPTANLKLTQEIPEGIYAAKVSIGRKKYTAAVFIGAAKTYNETETKAECFILDFSGDIYSRNITISLYNKIRENRKFETELELIEQIEKDVEKIRRFSISM